MVAKKYCAYYCCMKLSQTDALGSHFHLQMGKTCGVTTKAHLLAPFCWPTCDQLESSSSTAQNHQIITPTHLTWLVIDKGLFPLLCKGGDPYERGKAPNSTARDWNKPGMGSSSRTAGRVLAGVQYVIFFVRSSVTLSNLNLNFHSSPLKSTLRQQNPKLDHEPLQKLPLFLSTWASRHFRGLGALFSTSCCTPLTTIFN